MRASLLSAGAAVLATAAAQKPVTSCPFNSQVCYSVSVPSDSASSGKGDIFFQLRAPSDYSWAALGQGTQMAGSNIFIMYTDASGTNVTLSPRLGLGEFEPNFNGGAQVELLAGSGVANGVMTANVLCRNCNSWSGGSMSFSDSASDWICSYKAGGALNSNSQSAQLVEHDQHGTITFDLTKAAGGSSSINPFVSSTSSSSPSTSGGPSGGTSGGPSSGGSSGGDGDGDSSGASSSAGGDDDSPMIDNATIAHGALMAVAMVILFPMGAVLRRVAPSLSIWMHAAWQTFSLCVLIAGAGLGIWVATQQQQLMVPIEHPIIGLTVLVGMCIQPFLGLLQHSHFKRNGNRGPFGYIHIAFGTTLILLGIINGGLGLQLADNSNSATIAYAVIAAVLSLAYAAIVAVASTRKHRNASSEKAAPVNPDAS